MKNNGAQLQILRAKLRIYKEPLLEHDLLQELILSFAPKYEVHHLVEH